MIKCMSFAEEALDKITEESVQALQDAMANDASMASCYILLEPVKFNFEGVRVAASVVELRDGILHVSDKATEFLLEMVRVPPDATRRIFRQLPPRVKGFE